ncbi:hypothetical protein [Microbulbifer taiwanensis]|uniref:hypothetical protein n=1 Tax=Microbulbifer taiwanensis TaxID=986746 RepID=UPI00360D7ADB
MAAVKNRRSRRFGKCRNPGIPKLDTGIRRYDEKEWLQLKTEEVVVPANAGTQAPETGYRHTPV